MDRKTQDLAWSCLPREFREEVKKEYRKGYVCETLAMLITLFGHHNLTSDAEGEEEMLYVNRKKVQEIYRDADNLRKDPAIPHHAAYWNAEVELLQDLFGSKCLPDELNEDNFAKSEPNPAEPKFKVGDYVRYKGGVHKVVATAKDDRCYLNKILGCIDESDLEPYTEPKEDHIGENHEMVKDFDTILKDSFAKERRLNIATTIIEHIIKSEYYSLSEKYREDNIKEMVKVSLQITDAIMAECEKGGVK